MNKTLSIILTFDFAPAVTPYSLFDIGQNKKYYNQQLSDQEYMVAYESTIKVELKNILALCLTKSTPLAVYFSGTFLEMLQKNDPAMIKQIKAALASNHLELLGGTYHHSLASIYSSTHFDREIVLHQRLYATLLGYKAMHFYNTENLYCKEITDRVYQHGYRGIFAGTIDWYLWKDKNRRIFHAPEHPDLNVYLLDTDGGTALFSLPERTSHFIQFDSSQLTHYGGVQSIVHKAKTKAEILPLKEHAQTEPSLTPYHIKSPVMGSNRGLDTESLHSNSLQNRATKEYYKLEKAIVQTKNESLINDWKRLGHLAYILQMSKDENKHVIPYDFYNSYLNILNDMEIRTRTNK
ncbi:hypothetical protein BFP72_01405 [Reichenbachiella sp. 5M10]|uniref:hypothetical protein n=1 Tax=Reichenbachiella sp. 5M10 TaxID=1889772 RepID=UPI000C1603A4|nr:hypothetical protein [Reichenbachiella sp. 5M10]PIB34179.1 hypothetical protein BFP72_01405 [Reichenbachiella sp. 5M10]